ncbi:MAG: PHP domain-containing protein [Clostridia bacterium]|nr:PHP domain-containing protein [Clostridia bacterium]
MSGDLHCHTRLSNGSMGIEDIITLAKNKGVDVLAITDHDCQAGTVRAKIIGERNGVRVIPGVELSAIDDKTGQVLHILCYLPDFPDRLEGLCHKNAAAAKRAAQYMMIKVSKLYPVTSDVIRRCAAGSTNLYEQHIMHALMECGVTDGIYSAVYDMLFSPESEHNIIVKPDYAPVKEVLETIHAAGGIAVLAHPVEYRDDTLIERLLPLGLDGVEVWHPSATKTESDELYAFCKKSKLLMTGGSDFRGMYNRTPLAPGDYGTPKTQLNELLSFKGRQKRLAKKLAAEEDTAEAAASVR